MDKFAGENTESLLLRIERLQGVVYAMEYQAHFGGWTIPMSVWDHISNCKSSGDVPYLLPGNLPRPEPAPTERREP